jgi:hypothetical protein
MRRRFLPVAVVLALAGATLGAPGCDKPSPTTDGAVIRVSAPADRTPQSQGAKVYEGRIKDVRPAWYLLVLTVGEGKQARDLRFDISEARIVGPSGSEWKGQDLRVGDPVRVTLTADGRLVQQINVLPDGTSGLEEFPFRGSRAGATMCSSSRRWGSAWSRRGAGV